MQKRKYNNGDKIAYWTVISFDKDTKKYVCLCICGKESKINSSAIGKSSRSCGCMQKESVIAKIKDGGYTSIKNKIYDNYKRAASKRGYVFDLSKEEFNDITSKDCFYCLAKPNMVYKYGRGEKGYRFADAYTDYKYNGVDRVDNSIGYVLENCVPCCKICNNSKSTLSVEEWQEWIIRVHGNYIVRFND